MFCVFIPLIREDFLHFVCLLGKTSYLKVSFGLWEVVLGIPLLLKKKKRKLRNTSADNNHWFKPYKRHEKVMLSTNGIQVPNCQKEIQQHSFNQT